MKFILYVFVFQIFTLFLFSCSRHNKESGITRYGLEYRKKSQEKYYLKNNDLKFHFNANDPNHQLKYNIEGDYIIVHVYYQVSYSYLYEKAHTFKSDTLILSLNELGRDKSKEYKRYYQDCRIDYRIKIPDHITDPENLIVKFK